MVPMRLVPAGKQQIIAPLAPAGVICLLVCGVDCKEIFYDSKSLPLDLDKIFIVTTITRTARTTTTTTPNITTATYC